jgi:hypothetical protein
LDFGPRLVLDYPNSLLGVICERHGRMIRNKMLGNQAKKRAFRIELS